MRCSIDDGDVRARHRARPTVIPDDPDSLVYPYQLTAN